MKKLILTAAAAMMVLASCTKTKVESIDGPKEIAFKKIEGTMTKATTLTGTMGVIAYNHGTNTKYFDNTSFNNNGTYWAGSKYWPINGDALDFIVYAPYIDNSNDQITFTYNDDKTKYLNFKIIDNTTDQDDYLYGAEFYDNRGNSFSGYNKENANVPVLLKHALAKITINVSSTIADLFNINELILTSTNQAGTIEVEYNKTDGLVEGVTCTAATGGDAKVVDHEFTSLKTTVPTVTPLSESYLVFPAGQTSININYSMTGVVSPINTTLTLTGNWESGKHYVYNLTLTTSEIFFSPSVEEWPTSGGNYIEQDKTIN